MKVALTVWENRISPVFDSARMLMVTRIENGKLGGRQNKPFHGASPLSRATQIVDLDIEVLICGAVSDFTAMLIEGRGIQVIPFITGNAEEILDAYVAGTLSDARFRMPGCNANQDQDMQKGH